MSSIANLGAKLGLKCILCLPSVWLVLMTVWSYNTNKGSLKLLSFNHIYFCYRVENTNT